MITLEVIGSIRFNDKLFIVKIISLRHWETQALAKRLPRYPVAPVNNIVFFTYASEAVKGPIWG